jgi:hypothetical protein
VKFAPVLWLSLILGGGCSREQASTESLRAAAEDVDALEALAERDVVEVERGLPLGAKKLSELLVASHSSLSVDKADAPALRRALLRMRDQVPELTAVKSTFFAIVNQDGVAVGSDIDRSSLLGRNVFDAWNGLKPAKGSVDYVATVGRIDQLPKDGQAPTAPGSGVVDGEWIAAVPVPRLPSGERAWLLTGWTYRRFAFHLQATLEHDHREKRRLGQSSDKAPVIYVCLFDARDVYCAKMPGSQPVPEANERALASLGLHARTAGGDGRASGSLPGEGIRFAWAARRVLTLDPNVGVAVLRAGR